MGSKKKKDDGPSCACGKIDLYEEMIKMNEDTDKDSSANNAIKNTRKKTFTKKKENG